MTSPSLSSPPSPAETWDSEGVSVVEDTSWYGHGLSPRIRRSATKVTAGVPGSREWLLPPPAVPCPRPWAVL